MRKHLLGTTALVAAGLLGMATAAQAQDQMKKAEPVQVSVGGYHGQFFGWVDQKNRSGAGASGKPVDFDVQSDSEIWFNGRTELSNGIRVGFRVELEANTSGDQIDESYMFIEGGFGRVEWGTLNNVAYRMLYKAPDAFKRGWLNEGNHANFVINTTGSPQFDSSIAMTSIRFYDNDSTKINYYTPRIEGFQVGLSYVPEASQDREGQVPAKGGPGAGYNRGFAASVNFVRTFGPVDIAASAGYFTWNAPDDVNAPDPDAYSFGLNVGFSGFKVGASYMKIEDGRAASQGSAAGLPTFPNTTKLEGRAWDVGASYTFGPATVSLTYFDGNNKDEPVTGCSATACGKDKFTGIALAGSYVLGPGVSLEGVLWHSKFKGNNPTTDLDDNESTGFVGGVLLVF
jgi:predicted porin